MAYIEGKNRNRFILDSLESMIPEDSITRIIDEFVNNLDLKELGFTKTRVVNDGRPSYSPSCLLKLYIWGYNNKIHSSRKLAQSCCDNIQVMWLMEELKPDFRTISDFRKDNVERITKTFTKLNEKIFKVIELGFQSIDGTKIAASNSKENNFTQNKLDSRIEWLEGHIKNYLKQMDKTDANESIEEGEFTKEELEIKLKESEERLKKYQEYKRYMEENNLTQISLTDKDSKLMKSKNGFIVGYNVQTAVDSNTHIITDFQITNNPTDHGLLNSTVSKIKREQFEDKPLEIVADKGYIKKEDIIECLENGIIPNVINNKKKYDLEIDYIENECDKRSKEPKEISKCLHAGIIPDIYKDIIKECEVIDTTKRIEERENEYEIDFKDVDKIKEKAKEGYFIRDVERNIVYCPGGETMRQNAITHNGNIKYRNKFACKNCKLKNKCFSENVKFKDVEFNKDEIVKSAKWISKSKCKEEYKVNKEIKYIEIKKVKFTFYTDKRKMIKRFSLSEHPFGTIKRALNGYYFLLRNKIKVNAEFALLSIAYNIKRIINLIGYKKVMEIVTI